MNIETIKTNLKEIKTLHYLTHDFTKRQITLLLKELVEDEKIIFYVELTENVLLEKYMILTSRQIYIIGRRHIFSKLTFDSINNIKHIEDQTKIRDTLIINQKIKVNLNRFDIKIIIDAIQLHQNVTIEKETRKKVTRIPNYDLRFSFIFCLVALVIYCFKGGYLNTHFVLSIMWTLFFLLISFYLFMQGLRVKR